MNKNSENYKSTYSQLRPSAEAVERAMEISNKKKSSFKSTFKRLAAAAFAFAILIGGGFGINYALQKEDSSGELGVLIAYAATGEFLEVGSATEQELFYAIYVAPTCDEEIFKAVQERYEADRKKLDELMDKFFEQGYSASIRYGNSFSAATAEIYTIETGSFALSLDDYSEVQSFKIENTSIYGLLEFDYDFYGRLGYTPDTLPTELDDDYLERIETLGFPYPVECHEFEISGDVLRRSQEFGFYAEGKKDEVDKGYTLLWRLSDEFVNAIDNNQNFDLSQIEDTITFTVEFNDGAVKTASIDLYFDSDGYMHFGK